jgi:CDP-glucose 4,6-dehydratase
VVCITSDKCYENREWPWGYRETDKLGGHEPYSASKACAELAIAVFQDRRFQARANPERHDPVPISSTRAGNVIGGGDWALDRLIPDVVRALATNKDVVIRSPNAVRPWQHVLEPVSGYLSLGARMARAPGAHTAAYNFGPETNGRGVPVEEVVRGILARWPGSHSRLIIQADHSGAESGLLRLDCSRAEAELGWRPTWDLEQTLEQVVGWYRTFYERGAADMFGYSTRQIEQYVASAKEKKLAWATS